MGVRLSKAIAKFLIRERVCRVATIDERGAPHVVPVCHVLTDGKVYFATAGDSQKAKNLKADPRLTVLMDLYAEDWSSLKGAMMQGSARLIRRGPEFRKIRALLYQKYPQYPEDAALAEADDVIVEMTPTHVASWRIDT